MDTKTLLAFLLALPDADLANDYAIKQLRNKLIQVKQQAEISSQDWENIQGKLTNILEDEKNIAFKQLYQETQVQLENVEITSDLLPTRAELELAKPSNRKMGTLGYHFDKPEHSERENDEILNLAIVVLSNDKPATTSKTLLQKLTDFLKRKSKSNND